MQIQKLSKLFALLVVLSMLLAACAPAAAATEAPVEEPAATEAPAEEFAGDVLDAGGCDYGGQISSIEAVDRLTVVFNLCRPDPAFLVKIAFTPFGIEPKEWIEQTGGTGELLEHPIGTGPYMVTEWDRGNQIVYTRFDDYWGTPAIAQTAVLKWLTEGAARLQELQAGTADFASNLNPADYETVMSDPNLQIVYQENPNVFYIGMTNTFPPFDDVRVRQAVAMGIDRQRIVDNFYPAGSEVADYFTPCSIPNGCEGDPWYSFDPEAARALLAEAGYPDGFDTTISYRDVSRPYLLEAPPVAQELQAQLEANLGIHAEIVPVESGAYVEATTTGQTQGIHMFGWGADYPHITNFLDFHFGQDNPQLGTPYPEIYEPLLEASSIGDPAVAAPLYAQANNAVRELAPLVPIAHGLPAHSALASLGGAYYPPFGAPNFALLDPGDDTLVYVQNAEPISLYCADETDGESLTACQQVVEGLLAYATDSAETVPALATSCDPNEDSTVWTCNLRDGVKFHDGSDFDANDVVASLSAGLDAASPLHVGNTGSFDYYAFLWGGLINAPAE
jgi:ABC-type transport system substrate-binding protein